MSNIQNEGMHNSNRIGNDSQIQRKEWKLPIITRIDMKRTMMPGAAVSVADGTAPMMV